MNKNVRYINTKSEIFIIFNKHFYLLLQIFAQPLNDTSDSLPGVYNYLINCAATPALPIPYPKQFSQWKEGCYLLTPVDGDLASAQPPQDPTPSYIFYQVNLFSTTRTYF